MNPFDEETGPGAFNQILQPQQTQQAAPQMPEAEGGMADVLSPQGPSVFEKGREWAQANPMPAQMLLSTFMRMAQGGGANLGDTIGQGVAAGANAGLFHLAGQKQDAEKKSAEQRQLEKETADRKIRERQVGVSEGDLTLRQGNAPVDRAYRQAATKKMDTDTAVTEMQAPAQLDAIKARISTLQQQIANDRDGLKTNQLRRQLVALQIAEKGFTLELDKTYAPQERSLGVNSKQFANEASNIANDRALQENNDLSSLTPEQRLARTAKPGAAGKTPKTEQELYMDFLGKNADLFADDNGNFSPTLANEAWARLKNPNLDADKAAEEKAGIEAALAKVKVGEIVQAPNGKYYRRLK